jgi:hypothetical protein
MRAYPKQARAALVAAAVQARAGAVVRAQAVAQV